MPTSAPVLRSYDRGIATLTLDSPRNRNALSAGLITELTRALAEESSDVDVRAILITHTGPVFCAGIDVREALGTADHATGPRQVLGLFREIAGSPKPVVARVTGHARAAGLALLGACDIAVAATSATFAITDVRLGLTPVISSTTLLPRLDGRAMSRYFLAGERFDAAEAARIGLVSAAADDVDEALAPVLDGLRGAAPAALAATKQLTAAAIRGSLEQEADTAATCAAQIITTEEAREGIASFLERREPNWRR
ncbi:enoyl-CoA hydratase family protein [Saccharopolyspora sp. NPDC050642]|uniref:enoyl-CoA hydratase family protein n=1 Tax=Saccharopolyspora sp. NPDC050642 TaxID=3157099 RepID=UPI0033CD9E75